MMARYVNGFVSYLSPSHPVASNDPYPLWPKRAAQQSGIRRPAAHFAAAGNVPQAQGPVSGGAEGQRAIGAEGEAQDIAGMPLQDAHQRLIRARQVPRFDLRFATLPPADEALVRVLE